MPFMPPIPATMTAAAAQQWTYSLNNPDEYPARYAVIRALKGTPGGGRAAIERMRVAHMRDFHDAEQAYDAINSGATCGEVAPDALTQTDPDAPQAQPDPPAVEPVVETGADLGGENLEGSPVTLPAAADGDTVETPTG